jgi:hypothetical protein
MKKSILNLGKALSKAEQKNVFGGDGWRDTPKKVGDPHGDPYGGTGGSGSGGGNFCICCVGYTTVGCSQSTMASCGGQEVGHCVA